MNGVDDKIAVMDRYDANSVEGQLLPNKLGLSDPGAINEEEAAGFLRAEHDAIDALSEETMFSVEYLYDLHRSALGHLYDFAGRLRTVNMSKGGFMFAPSQFLPQTLAAFADQYLVPVNAREWASTPMLLDHLAEMHAELLYIHPFREGNGRIIRLFTRLIYIAKTSDDLDFHIVAEARNFERYITAVQQASRKEYNLMKELFRELRP